MMKYFKYLIAILFIDGIFAKNLIDDSFNLTDQKITRLDLSHNNLLGLKRGIFNNYKDLEVLFITNSGLTSIEDGTFYDLENLTELNVDKNSISRLSSKIFRRKNNLEKLVVSNNMLRDLVNFNIDHFPKLKYLDISGNLLEAVPRKLIKKLKRNIHFTLISRGNAWNCSQNWTKLLDFRLYYKFCISELMEGLQMPKSEPLKKKVEPNFIHCLFWAFGAFWLGIIVGNVFLIRKIMCKVYVEGKTNQGTQQDSMAVLYTVDPPKNMGQLHEAHS